MNILHLSRTMGQGGAEKVVIDLCENTADMFDTVIVLSTGGINVAKLEELNIHHIILKMLFKVIKNYKIDIIHSHHRMAAFYSQIVKIFFNNIRLVYTAHNVFYDKRRLTKLSLKNTNIISVGEGVKKNLIEYFKIDKSQINIINNSVKPENISKCVRPVECEQRKIIISCIGRLSEQKGIEYFIKAIANVLKRDLNLGIRCLIIGDGELRNELENLVDELKLNEDIKFLGYRSNVYDYIKYSDFIVSSSLWEGFPLTLIECFAVGKGIIATDISGNNEIITHKYNGLLVKPKDIDALAEAIIYYCKNSYFLNEMEKNAFDSYVNNYSYNKYISKYKNVYNDIINYRARN